MPNKSISKEQDSSCYDMHPVVELKYQQDIECLLQHCQKYLHIYQKSGLSLEDILSLDDTSLCSLFQEQEKQQKNVFALQGASCRTTIIQTSEEEKA